MHEYGSAPEVKKALWLIAKHGFKAFAATCGENDSEQERPPGSGGVARAVG